jgi:hypothetical protein
VVGRSSGHSGIAPIPTISQAARSRSPRGSPVAAIVISPAASQFVAEPPFDSHALFAKFRRMTTNRLMRVTLPIVLCAVLLAAAATAPAAHADDDGRHAGYYYPEPRSEEVYEARLPVLPDSDRRRRVGFVTVLTAQMLERPYPPRFVMFAKGTEAEKLIITAVTRDSFDTLYRARALFAMLTAMARATPFFAEQAEADRYTFFDLLKLLGFTQLVFTNGDDFAHRVELR